MQIAADVLQRPVHLLAGHPGSCLGAAWVAAVGVGGEGWEGVGRFVTRAATVEPEPALAGLYDAAYARYRALYEALRPVLAGLS